MKTMRTLFTLLLLALTVPVLAAPGDVKWTAKLAPEDARAGEGAQIVLTAQIEGGLPSLLPDEAQTMARP